MKSKCNQLQPNNFRLGSSKSILLTGLALVAFSTVTLAAAKTSPAQSKVWAWEPNTPLCTAIYKGDLATVKKFIEYGADVNEMSNGLTPLMFAARYNKVEIVKYLLERGADKSIKDDRGYTAAQYAEFSNSQEALTYLKKA